MPYHKKCSEDQCNESVSQKRNRSLLWEILSTEPQPALASAGEYGGFAPTSWRRRTSLLTSTSLTALTGRAVQIGPTAPVPFRRPFHT